jgi:hypothetical protein
LFLLSTDTLEKRRLTAPPGGIGDLRFAFSHDADKLAIIRLGAAVSVNLLSVTTGRETVLLSGQNEWFGGVAWSAGGEHLILSANQVGVRRLWTLPVAGGELQRISIAGENAYYPPVSSRSGHLAFVHDFYDWDLARVTLEQGRAPTSTPFSKLNTDRFGSGLLASWPEARVRLGTQWDPGDLGQ